MHRLNLVVSRAVAVMALLAVAGCSEDLGPVTTAWTQLQASMSAKATELHKQYTDITTAVRGLPPVGASDSVGQDLTSKLSAALSAHATLLSSLDSALASGTTAVQQAIKTGKVAAVQKAMDDAKAAYDGVISKLGVSGATTISLLGQLKAHDAQLAAEAAQANASGSKTDFTDIDFKPGKAEFLFDRPNTQATLDKLLAFVNSCPELVVNLVGHTSNEGTAAANKKLSVARATAVKKWLLSKGVKPKKIHSVSGVGAKDNVVPEPPAKSAAAKAMGPTALEEARRKNRRITVQVVTPCPAH